MASTDARAFPTKNTAYRVTFPILDADGDLVTGATGLDSEVSKDGGTFADCTNEATEIATSSGIYYLDLTSTEMNADTVAIIVKTSSAGAKTTPMVFYPATLTVAQLGVNAVQLGGTAQTGRDIGASVLLSSGTGAGQISLSSGAVLLQATQTGVTIPTVTTLTNLPAITSNWLTAAGIAASALNGKGDWNIGKTGYALTATTGLGNQTANITGNLSGSVGSVTTVSDKTGYSLTATTGLGNQTANITGNLSGSVGSVTGAVGSVTGAVGSVTGAVGSVTSGVTLANGAHGGAAATMQLGGAGGLTATHTGNTTGSVGSVTGAVGSVTGAVGSVTSGVTVTTNNDKTGYSLTATTGLGNQTANITGNLSGSVGSVTGAVGSVTGAVGSVTGAVTLANGAHGGAAATLQLGGAGGLTATHTGNTTGSVGSVTGTVGSVTGAVGSVTSGVTVTTNNDKTGYSLTATTGLGNQTANITGNISGSVGSVTGAVGSVTGAVGSVTSGVTLANGAHGGAAATMQLGGAGGLTATHTGNTTGSVGSVTGAVGSVTGAVGSVTSGVTVTTNNDKTGYSLTATTGLGNQTANITGNLSGSVGSVTGAVGSVTGNVSGTVATVTNLTNNHAKYMHGAVWIDSVSGAAGTVSYTNGIMTNPVASLTDAKTIADNLKMKRFWIQAGSSLTLAADYVGYVFDGRGYALALGTRDISHSQFERIEGLSGTGTCPTGEAVFFDCHLNAVTIGEADFNRCHLNGTVTLSQASIPYLFHGCAGVAALAKITFAAAAQSCVVSKWGGVLTIAGMVSGNTLILDGNGDVTLDNTNTGGTVYISGNIKLTNNGSGQTIIDTSRFDEDQNITTVTNLTNAPTAGDFTATMKTSLNAATPAVTVSDKTGFRLSATGVDDVWDEAIAGHLTGGTTGAALNSATAPSAASVADAVWDEAISGHLTAGSTGNALNAAGSAGDPWGTGLPGVYGAGSAGYIVGTNLNATVSSRSSHSAADVWSSGTRTLTSFGTLIADIWAYATRTLTAISDSSGVTTLLSRIASALTITGGKVDVNDKTGFSISGTKTTLDALNDLSAANIRTAVGLASANLDTQLADLPTNAELTSALGTADDATLAAIAGLNNLSAAQVTAAVPTATENAAAVLSAATANPIDANIQEVNDVTIIGDGDTTPWGPA